MIRLISAKSYETQVVLLLAVLGSVRMIISVVIDVLRTPVRLPELLTDSLLLLLFTSMLAYVWKNTRISRIHPGIGFLFTVLLALNFLQFDGLFGNARFNYYLGFFIVGLLYTGRWFIIHMTIHTLIMVVIAVSSGLGLAWIEPLNLNVSLDVSDFFFALLTSGFLTYYLKAITLREIAKSENLAQQLSLNVGTAKSTNELLREQSELLRVTQAHLEGEVSQRTQALTRQQEAIQSYIRLNTSGLSDKISQLQNQLSHLPAHQPLGALVQACAGELEAVAARITSTIEAREQLDRTKVKA